LARYFVKNRRDGARLLSSALVITGSALFRLDHPIGQLLALIGAVVCVYWWLCSRQLQN
jgi:hypothetical protein